MHETTPLIPYPNWVYKIRQPSRQASCGQPRGAAPGTWYDLYLLDASRVFYDHPVNGPICGMAPESVTPKVDLGENEKPRDMPRRLLASLVITLPVVVSVLYLLFGALLSPMTAALGMSLSLVSVISNARRLRRLKLEEVATIVL
jgi:hypothetical protein